METEEKCGKPLSPQQLRTLLADIACCSLMRLDEVSMDKLWDLMVVVFKWQLFVARDDPHRLINVTFKHLDGCAKLMPELKKQIMVDMVKMKILTMWDTCDDEEKRQTAANIQKWVEPFNVKISILMRLGLQDDSCQFIPIDLTNRTHADLLANIGENIYKKHPKKHDEPVAAGGEGGAERSNVEYKNHREFDELADQLQINPLETFKSGTESQDTMISLLHTLHLDSSDAKDERQVQSNHEFVQIRSSNSDAREDYLTVDPERIMAIEPDLLALMKVPPHIPKY